MQTLKKKGLCYLIFNTLLGVLRNFGNEIKTVTSVEISLLWGHLCALKATTSLGSCKD